MLKQKILLKMLMLILIIGIVGCSQANLYNNENDDIKTDTVNNEFTGDVPVKSSSFHSNDYAYSSINYPRNVIEAITTHGKRSSFLLSLDPNKTGTYMSIDIISPQHIIYIGSGYQSEGWSHVSSTSYLRDYVLFYKDHGEAFDGNNLHIYKLNSDGTLGRKTFSAKIASGYHIVKFINFPYAQSCILLYKKDGLDNDGYNLKIFDFDKETGKSEKRVLAKKFRSGWTHIFITNFKLCFYRIKGKMSSGYNLHMYGFYRGDSNSNPRYEGFVGGANIAEGIDSFVTLDNFYLDDTFFAVGGDEADVERYYAIRTSDNYFKIELADKFNLYGSGWKNGGCTFYRDPSDNIRCTLIFQRPIYESNNLFIGSLDCFY